MYLLLCRFAFIAELGEMLVRVLLLEELAVLVGLMACYVMRYQVDLIPDEDRLVDTG